MLDMHRAQNYAYRLQNFMLRPAIPSSPLTHDRDLITDINLPDKEDQPFSTNEFVAMASQQDLQELLRLLTVTRKIPMMQAMGQVKALQGANLRR
jgi:hypothetical protein